MKLRTILTVAGLALAIASTGNLSAQDQQRRNRGPGGGDFDPARFEQMMLDRVRERLEVKNDSEWNAIEPLIKKVSAARREQIGGGMRGMMRGGRGGGPGGTSGGNNSSDNNGGGNRGTRGGGFFGEPSAEEEALTKAVESNASKDELKSKMSAYRKAREAKEKQLKSAQDELKKVLSVKQEAIALEMGLVQ